ncbi:D-methionine ABC transporter ATP-binding protein MetN [Thermoclostridium stercorarium subsp. stercorarium DSM 8532]|uniref:D-methionine ABC transporter ATP-binding protein MetN n=3 Tax=Thermoclostridium stercorarium TaxID=1510 RepID=L7VK35_THES1|nr:ATP-binding cassette domain-containing protein [Thermoclostridium stercorarium]AGC67077.1 D-methionine ABC transporter ATP-binding protein MetN [Thermoclostridium stercorarium subsp. stercorarium DSM 8532]AGI38160.1 ABC transporter ATPase subunit [Thermoclostridium stercorarium subsp. stercorarium DSM 8532]ANW97567.1 ABC transporter [Thermoclostridium stercorarium subsp. thermolacticum DSM 2910]ANX00126.1 ABC transporter [Thermoclostridium stercorarium subsp. leptospartum DSM 9219]UZQ85684.
MISLRNLCKTFETANGPVEVLKNIDLDIKKGEVFGIIGLSGAGKSTLVRCINLLEKPTSGEIIFDGMNLMKLSRKELLKVRQSMGMVFQSFNLLQQRTALKNVCYPLEIAHVPKDRARKKAVELLEMVGLADKLNAYPSQLSGGQKQRVAIARALATDPKVLLCDEITSALDPNTTRSILELLQNINRTMGVTIVMITHEMEVIEQICHRVAVINGGRIVEMGDVKEVFLRPRSETAKQLILPKSGEIHRMTGKKCLRIIFDGNSAFEPIISNMTLECRAVVNILYANTKSIEGKAYGEMLLQLPDDETSIKRILAYLDEKGIYYREEEINV